jgi:hypothetical protein
MEKMLIGFCIILSACELVVDVKVPVDQPKITINSDFTPDTTWLVEVHRSKYILDDGPTAAIENAVVQIVDNNSNVVTLTHIGYGQYVSNDGLRPMENVQYELKVSAPAYVAVSAQSSLPPVRTISNAEVTWLAEGGVQQEFNFSIDVTFIDDGNTDDYYEFKLFVLSEWQDPQSGEVIESRWPIYAYTDDPALKNENIERILFDDKLINGKEIKFRIKGMNFFSEDQKIEVLMRSLSKDLYKYQLTAGLQNYSSGDPFAQPVPVYNNIINGFGIFGGYRESKFIVEP